MACTLRMIRFDRRFDTNIIDSRSDYVEELKAVAELESSKNFIIYKLYKYKDKFARMIDGSQDQYRHDDIPLKIRAHKSRYRDSTFTRVCICALLCPFICLRLLFHNNFN
uniref:Uncharacterized protein n=1 Tax=Parascaris equorum TaxID=6256 RepID=A0A914SJW9_PAREQ